MREFGDVQSPDGSCGNGEATDAGGACICDDDISWDAEGDQVEADTRGGLHKKKDPEMKEREVAFVEVNATPVG